MKKLLLLMVAVFAMTMTASAQNEKCSPEQQKRAYQNVINRMYAVPGTNYAITVTPIAVWEYNNVNGMSKQGITKHYSASQAMPRLSLVDEYSDSFFAKKMNELAKRKLFKVATKKQISEAHKIIGLHGDVSQNSTQTQGFFITMPVEDWKRLKTN